MKLHCEKQSNKCLMIVTSDTTLISNYINHVYNNNSSAVNLANQAL